MQIVLECYVEGTYTGVNIVGFIIPIMLITTI